MADNITVPATGSGTATPVVATDDVAGVHYQRVKLVDGTLDGTAAIAGDATNGLDVDVTRLPALVAGAANIGDVDVLTVPAPLSTQGGGLEATALRVTLASDGTGLVSIDTMAGTELAVRSTILDPLDDAGAAVTIKYVRVNATADADNVIVAAVGGKAIRVLGYAFAVTAAGTISLQDTAVTPVVHAQFPLAANGGVSYAGGLAAPAFQTATGTGVEINNPAAVDTLGHLTYIEV